MTTRRRIDSCNDAVCLLVNFKLISKHKQNLRGKLKKDFAFETTLFENISVKKSEIYLTFISNFEGSRPEVFCKKRCS